MFPDESPTIAAALAAFKALGVQTITCRRTGPETMVVVHAEIVPASGTVATCAASFVPAKLTEKDDKTD
jgi:hypothetical protein